MKQRAILTAALLMWTVAQSPSPARAEEESPFSASASVAFNSDYMFRGFNLYDGMSIQPSASAFLGLR